MELKPCPFCGEKIGYYITDMEGNLRDESYISDPWSGLSFAIKHTISTSPRCPIASHDDEILGTALFESLEELALWWNTRATDPLLKEMAEALGKAVGAVNNLIENSKGVSGLRIGGSFESWLSDLDAAEHTLQKYRDQHATPSPPLDGDC